MPTNLPPMVPLWSIARALQWSAEKTRRAFLRTNLATRIPGTRDWYVARERLTSQMPQLIPMLEKHFACMVKRYPGRRTKTR